MVAERLENTADDTVSSRVNLDAGLVAVGLSRVAYSIGVDRAVVELDTVGDALHIIFADVAVAPHVVNLFLDEFRMRQLGSEVAVVCEEEYARSVSVETPDGVYALVASALDDIHYSHAPVGIVACGDAVFGFVEQDVALAFGSYDLFIVLNDVVVRYLCAELSHNLSVDFDQTLLDEFVGFASRAYAGIAHIFIETYLFVGVGYGHFVLNALRTRSEALATAGETVVVLAVAVVEWPLSGTSLIVELSLTALIVVWPLLALTALSALAVILSLTALVVVWTLLTGLISTLTALVVVGALLALLISTLVVVRPLLTGLISAFAVLVSGIVVVASRLVGAVVVIVVVSTLTLLISALLALLIRPLRAIRLAFGVVLAGVVFFGTRSGIVRTVVARTFGALFGRMESLSDARTFRFFFRGIGIHLLVVFCY